MGKKGARGKRRAAEQEFIGDGFLVLHLPLLSYDIPNASRQLFVRKHEQRGAAESENEADSTAFVTGFPRTASAAALGHLFGEFGEIESVVLGQFHDTKAQSAAKTAEVGTDEDTDDLLSFFPPEAKAVQALVSADFARVTFRSADGLGNLLSAASRHFLDNEHLRDRCAEGFKARTFASRPQPSLLEDAATLAMERFDEQEAARIAEEEAKRGMVDEDGFVMVGSGGRKGRTEDESTGTTVGAASFRATSLGGILARKRAKEKIIKNFYSFQRRQAKQEQLAQLRKKFEEDKERIAKFRAQRKFRPY